MNEKEQLAIKYDAGLLYELSRVRIENEALKEKLAKFENPKNWIRGFDWEGKLVSEYAVFVPKLRGDL